MRSFVIKFGSCVFLKLHTMIACDNVKYLVEVKPTKKIEGEGVNLARMVQNWAQNKVFHIFLKFGSLVFL